MAEVISAGEFRNGLTIEFEGDVYTVIEFQHVKPGKGAAFVRTKMKNIVIIATRLPFFFSCVMVQKKC